MPRTFSPPQSLVSALLGFSASGCSETGGHPERLVQYVIDLQLGGWASGPQAIVYHTWRPQSEWCVSEMAGGRAVRSIRDDSRASGGSRNAGQSTGGERQYSRAAGLL